MLDALVNLTEKYLMLLASTTAQCARSSHNDSIPSVSDVRQALTECSALVPYADATEEDFRQWLRRPIGDYASMAGGQARMMAELDRREEQDTRDVKEFLAWFQGPQYAEIKRIASSSEATMNGPGDVGVGGSHVQVEDILTTLKKRRGKGAQEAETRFTDTVLGNGSHDTKAVTIEGGSIRSLRAWAPSVRSTENTAMEIDAS